MNLAIGKLFDASVTTHLGTAFAVSASLALTAFHCIGVRRTGKVTRRQVVLEFLTGDAIPGRVVAGSGEADYAILELETMLPNTLTPIPLLDLPAPHENFRCGGYPVALEHPERLERPDITWIGGQIRAVETPIFGGIPAIQLFSDESAAQLPLGGLSGAPVLVAKPGGAIAEGAVGLVRWNPFDPDQPDRGRGGMLFSSPARLIAEENGQFAHAGLRIVRSTDPPMMAEAPPPDFVARPDEYEKLIAYLLGDGSQTVAITATLKGAGGFGKTTLAQAICQDSRIRDAFPDGILWVTIGDEAKNVLPALQKLYRALTGRPPEFVDQDDAATQVAGKLGSRQCLIVVDDVWNAAHLKPFLQGGARCARLVTTRLSSIVPAGAEVVPVDAMQVEEATALLAAGLTIQDRSLLVPLAKRLGEWPLLLKLVNGRLRVDVSEYGRTPTEAVETVIDELDEFGLTSFDVDDPHERGQAVAASIGVSIKHLNPHAQYGRLEVDEDARFYELAVFPEDAVIPIDTVALLWQQTGGLSALATERLCRRLADLSLLLRFDLSARTVVLHDVIRRYLVDHASDDLYRAWQQHLLDGYRARSVGQLWALPDDKYVYRYLLWHLHEAGHDEEIAGLLTTYAWLAAKLNATDILSLIADFDLVADKKVNQELSLLRHALQMSVSTLARDKSELPSQLHGRLLGLDGTYSGMIAEIAANEKRRWLRTVAPSLTPPGGNLLYTLSGHKAGVETLLLTVDGRLISSCRDHEDSSVKVWDLGRGELLHSLEGHTDGGVILLLTADDRLISSCPGINSLDHAVKVWDLERGALLHSLEGHTAGADKLLLTEDGRLISSCSGQYSGDHTMKVWDLDRGVLLHSLEGHSTGVDLMLLTTDGRLISAFGWRNVDTDDQSVRVWDLERGVLLHSLEGRSNGVSDLLLTPDGCLITSFYHDPTVKVWDLERGVLLHSLEGHTTGISNLLLTPDGRLISSSSSLIGDTGDHTVNVWDLEQGVLLHSLKGHTAGISNLLLTLGGRLISSSADATVKVWDLEQGVLLHSLEIHTTGVSNILLTPNGRLISSSRFGEDTVNVWDPERGDLLYSLEGLTDVSNLLFTHDGRLISSSFYDTAVKVWDVERGALLHSLEGHTDAVSSLLLTTDGRLISSCFNFGRDHTIRVWSLEAVAPPHSLEQHTSGVTNLCITTDGRLISSCGTDTGTVKRDSTVKVWNLERCALSHSLNGHTAGVDNLLLTVDGRLVSSCRGTKARDGTVKVWDLDLGTLIHSLEGHTDNVDNLLLTPDGRLISSCSSRFSLGDHTVKVWDLDRGTLIHSLEGHTSNVSNLLLTADDRLISSCKGMYESEDHTVKVWDLERGTLLYSLEGHTGGVSNLKLTTDGHLISCCGESVRISDPTVRVWDIVHGALLYTLDGHTASVDNLQLTASGCLISSCNSNDFAMKVWDLERGALLHSLEGHATGADNLLLTPDGFLISSCSNTTGYRSYSRDYTVKVWDLERGVLLHSLEGHRAGVDNLLLTADGRLISSCRRGSDPAVNVWDLKRGVLLHSLEGHLESIQFMLQSPMRVGRLLTIGGSQAILWDIDSGKRIAQFTADGDIRSCVWAHDGTIVLGDGIGRVHFLRLRE